MISNRPTGVESTKGFEKKRWQHTMHVSVFAVLVSLYAVSLVATFSLRQTDMGWWDVVAFGSSFGLSLLLPLVVPAWIVAPLRDAAQRRGLPVQFMLVDVFCLFASLQVVTGLLLLWQRYTSEPLVFWIFFVFAWIVYGGAWVVTVCLLSQAGIVCWRYRTLFLLLGLPVTASNFVVLPFAIGAALVLLHEFPFRTNRFEPTELLVSISTSLVLLLSAYAVGRLTRRMVAQTERYESALTPKPHPRTPPGPPSP